MGTQRAIPRGWVAAIRAAARRAAGFEMGMAVCVSLSLAAIPSVPAPAADGPVIGDERVLHAVEAEILVDPAVPADWINVDVRGGIVTLWGTVDHLLAKERAAELARTVRGVRAVLNDLEVVPAEPTSDERVRRKVVNALAMDSATEAYEIEVRVQDGAVTLTGSVESWQERELAATVAKRVKGVRGVANEVRIRPSAGRPDSEIKADVTRRLQADVWVEESLIGVMVEDGVVTLTGTVGSAEEKARAYTDAWVVGAAKVDTSRLEVKWWARNEMRRSRPQLEQSDEEVRRAVQDVLGYDPRVTPFDVKVRVRDGIVLLTGVVDNARAKTAAEEDARATTGARGVRNLLKVRPVQRPDDPIIARNVAQAFLQDPYLDRLAIRLQVRSGEVRLSGKVNSTFEASRAERVASRVKGVVDVINHLDVRTPRSDEQDWRIRQEIADQLRRSPYVQSEDIAVSVEDGIATLTGRIGSWTAYREATRQAFQGGALKVRNELEVETDHASSKRAEDGDE